MSDRTPAPRKPSRAVAGRAAGQDVPAHRAVLAAVAALPFAVALAVVLPLYLSWRDRLPDPVATHFTGAQGVADGTTPVGGVLWLCVAVPVCGGVLAGAFCGLLGDRARWPAVGAWGVAGLLGTALVETLWVNRDAADADGVRLPLWLLAVALGAAAVLAALAWASLRWIPEPAAADRGEPVERLDLRRDELAAWGRATGSAPLALLGLLTVAAGAALTPVLGWVFLATLAVAGLVCLCFARIHVTVGARGLVVAPAGLPWPRLRVPLDGITRATSREVDALRDFGGWGYRVRAGATGVILRSGESLVVRRTGGREFAVTVQDSATAAAVLNSLVDQRKER